MSEYRPFNSRLTRYAAPGRSRGPNCTLLKYVIDNRDPSKEWLKKNTLPELIVVADHLFSLVLRYRYANEYGVVMCFTCGARGLVADIQCGHYMDRDNMAVRWSFKNCRPQCPICNENNDGARAVFEKSLEAETPGITQLLRQQANEVFPVTRNYVSLLIIELAQEYSEYVPNE